ncbi:hypothetical protein A3C89_04020 [Candidatus Kaiserbacteria bacterium RIFCSPHIGHO2_02_FULL_50_50]|uniref:Bacterial Ig-like domain-containing protein n=1 Tax=Candidatus Kaiserbacteria bacterium RIFCSPHIGHO2_02_FULL_50_50 TaxID=1798492 RepID=A0A1F6DGK4_9BACT|nr:MAG: hypothetical protein A3C89_04020 [Candidatus Kaiserbacteria bacterium RIFCSPHIGHO2_02_FULL_50_50]OGG89345.1 MAG: hypothetical protein A3G62_02310 [Candidatus Kaiserbacteria bacterium RIFCSPLOWO2_12_FULL_50_10]
MKKYIYCVGIYLLLATGAAASETVGTVTTGGNEGFAWSDQAGWVNFGTANGAITIQDSGITGYAWIPNYGWMNMNPSNGGVSVAAGGALSGYAWSSALGWVNFSGVSINSSGVFTGQATGASIGTLTFSCTNCSVKTDYRPPALETTSTESSSGSSGGATPGEPTPASLLPSPADAVPFTTEPTTSPEESVTDAEGELLPSELFDIRLVIDRRTISSVQKLVARTTFESFGRVPTPVDIFFSIVDASGNEVYSKKDNVVIQTEGVLVTRFADVAELPDGEYVLRMRTLYNVDVEDFFEIPFTINAATGGGLPWVWIAVGIFGLVLLATFFIAKRRMIKKV